MSTTVKLLTGLSRGNMKYVAQQVVEIPDGLAARLIERKQAEATDQKPDTVKKAVAAAIKKSSKAKKPAAKKPAPAAGANDAPAAGANDAPDAGANDAPDAGANDAPDAGASKD